ncbi:hypothetical protein KKG65_00860 [Patescibacteria group bacterium]|nr:hypothetical protein [Patescibacteria group bacterium]
MERWENRNRNEEIDYSVVADVAGRAFLDARDRAVGALKIVTGGGLALGGLAVTLVGFLPGGIIAAGMGALIVNSGMEQAVFKPMDRMDRKKNRR